LKHSVSKKHLVISHPLTPEDIITGYSRVQALFIQLWKALANSVMITWWGSQCHESLISGLLTISLHHTFGALIITRLYQESWL